MAKDKVRPRDELRGIDEPCQDGGGVLQVFSRTGGVNDVLRGFRPSLKSQEVYLEGSKEEINETQGQYIA